MSSSNLKPSKDQLESNLNQFRVGAGARLSDLDFEVLQLICNSADRAMRLVARTALAQVSEALKVNLFPSLTAGNAPLPVATQVGDGDAYRIAIPISFVAQLLAIAPTRSGLPPKSASDYLVSSTIVAVLAAYAHELNHVMAGHLGTKESLGQETHADYIGGGLLWAWLQRPDIAELCHIPAGKQTSMCVYGLLHLISALSDAGNGNSLYLPRSLRFAVFSGGAGFYAGETAGKVQGDFVGQAFEAMPACPESLFESLTIRNQHAVLIAQIALPQMQTRLLSAFSEMHREKSAWYAASEHLGPIKKQLHLAMKRDP